MGDVMDGWDWMKQPFAAPLPAGADPNSFYSAGPAQGLPQGANPADYQKNAGGVEQQVYSGLIARGMSPHVAAAFMLNFKDESGLNPGINEQNPIVPGSRGGYGLYQLTGPRRRAYEAYAAERGLPFDSVDAQLDFMMTELQGPESRAWSRISAAQNTGDAAAAIVNDFLRPAEEHRARRVAKYAGSDYVPPNALSGPAGAPSEVAQNQLATQPARPQFAFNALEIDPIAFMNQSNALYRPI